MSAISIGYALIEHRNAAARKNPLPNALLLPGLKGFFQYIVFG